MPEATELDDLFIPEVLKLTPGSKIKGMTCTDLINALSKDKSPAALRIEEPHKCYSRIQMALDRDCGGIQWDSHKVKQVPLVIANTNIV